MSREFELLKTSRIFKAVNDKVIQQLVKQGKVRTYQKDTILGVELAESDEIYLIIDGKVRIEVALDPSGTRLESSTGDFIGLLKFFKGEKMQNSFTAAAKSDLRLICWKAALWRKICDEDVVTGYKLAMTIGSVLVERMRKWHVNILNSVSWGIE